MKSALRNFLLITISAIPLPPFEAQAQSQRVPQFAEYKRPVYRGPVGHVNLSDPQAYQYRTRLRNGSLQPVNFAGHYQIVEWGCDTDCDAGAIIDALTGQVLMLPSIDGYEMDTAVDGFHHMQYRPDSALLIMSGSIGETGPKGWHFFYFENGNLNEIKFIEWRKPTENAGAPQDEKQPPSGSMFDDSRLASRQPPNTTPAIKQNRQDDPYAEDYKAEVKKHRNELIEQFKRRKDEIRTETEYLGFASGCKVVVNEGAITMQTGTALFNFGLYNGYYDKNFWSDIKNSSQKGLDRAKEPNACDFWKNNPEAVYNVREQVRLATVSQKPIN